MEFRLTYMGPLLPHNSTKKEHIHDVRKAFDPQLRLLWSEIPLISKHPKVLNAKNDKHTNLQLKNEKSGKDSEDFKNKYYYHLAKEVGNITLSPLLRKDGTYMLS